MHSTAQISLRSFALLSILGSCYGQPSTAAGALHFPMNEDLRHVRQIGAPHLSPDGRSVLVQIWDATADGGKPHLWMVDISGNAARQLTYSPSGDRNGESLGEWMPDGESVLFLAHRGEQTQLYSLPVHGGEAHAFDLKITPRVDESKRPGALPPADAAKPETTVSSPAALPIEVASYAVSPDGKTIAVTARDPQTPGEKKQHDEKADAVEVDRDPHGTRLYLLDPATNKLTPVDVPTNLRGLSWSPLSDRLIALCEAPNNADDLGPSASAWLVSMSDPGHPAKIAHVPATVQSVAWSADGKHIYFHAQAEEDAPPGESAFFHATLDQPAVRNLSRGLGPSVSTGNPIALNDGAMLLGINDGVKAGAARFDPARDDFTPYRFDRPVVTGLATNRKQTGWVYIGRGSTEPPALYYSETLGSSARALPTPSLFPEHWQTVPSKVIEWKSDGFTIQGLLFLPPEAAQRKVPLIVDVHGGPTGVWLDDFRPFTNFLIGHGWAVLLPNPRGSVGYGTRFAAANKNDLGGGDYRDIMAGVDAVLAQFPIDPDRLGLMGYSYGGEMAGFVEGKTDRFKGIVSGAPVIDQLSEYGTETGSWYDRWFYGRPWEHLEDAWRQSPLAGVAHAKTPFLLLQGLNDTTDPPGQSREMYRALRQHGVDVTLIEYPRENHGQLSGAMLGNPQPEPWHGFDARQRIAAFFQKAFHQQPSAAPTASAVR